MELDMYRSPELKLQSGSKSDFVWFVEDVLGQGGSDPIDIVVPADAQLNINLIQRSPRISNGQLNLVFRLKKNSALCIHSWLNRPDSFYLKYEFSLDESAAQVNWRQAVIADEGDQFGVAVETWHRAPETYSQHQGMAVVGGHVRGELSGHVGIEPFCPQSNSSLNLRGLLTSAAARLVTRPKLEIYTDDVKASHGAAVGPLPLENLFYMTTRGLSLTEARATMNRALLMSLFNYESAPQFDLSPLEQLSLPAGDQ